MRRAILLLLVGLAALPALPGSAAAAGPGIEPLLQEGLEHYYNLEYDESIASFRKALRQEPENPRLYNLLAHAYLFQLMHRLGQLDANLYAESNAFLKEAKREPKPEEIQPITEAIDKAKALARARLERNDDDKEALYSLGIAYGIEGNYLFTIKKSWFAALDAAGEANERHKKVLKLDPNFHDAKLVTGLYEYVIGSIPGGVKWLAALFGYRGSKQRGIQLLEEARAGGKRVRTDAAILLGVVYNRERQYARARELFAKIAERYPRNPLLPLEVARTYEREGNLKAASDGYAEVVRRLEDSRPGYQRLPRERLCYQLGALYQRQREHQHALAAYSKITESGGDGLLVAYARLRRGEVLQALKRRDEARAEYQRVATMPFEEPRREAAERLRAMDTRDAS